MTHNTVRGREAALGRFVLAQLLTAGPDAGDRLAAMVREAVRLQLARENALAEEATDPWALPRAPRRRGGSGEGQPTVATRAEARPEAQP